MLASSADAPDARDSGFGLIEIVISLFLLGLLAIAFLPLLVTSMQTTVVNSTTATATQLVNQQLDLARAAGDTCDDLIDFRNETLSSVPADARGVTYQPSRTVADCPASFPNTILVTLSVSAVESTISPITATTLIYLRAAS